jgi:para-nitrobenzyl esterase
LFLKQPVIDGHSLLRHPWDPDAPEMSSDIPLLIGNDKDETTLFTSTGGQYTLFNLDFDDLKKQLINSRVPEDKVDMLITVYFFSICLRISAIIST